MDVRFAVLGAGNGGQAIAADLTLRGYDVSLYDRYEAAVAPVRDRGGIRLIGAIKGFAPVRCVTNRIAEAMAGRQVLMIVVPAFAHRYIIETAVPHLEDGQILVLIPGSTGGALEACTIFDRLQLRKEVFLAETESLFYACRLVGPAKVRINAVKRRLALAALPASNTTKVLGVLAEAYAQLEPVPNVLHTSFHNANAIVHPPLTLLNLSYCESTGGAFDFYSTSAMPSALNLVERVDRERMSVAAAMGVRPISLRQWMKRMYGVDEDTLTSTFRTLAREVYDGIPGPSGPKARYLTEDVPMGLVPMASFGRLAGIQTPVMDLLIEMASLLTDTDFWSVGRTVDKLGLGEMTPRQILAHCEELHSPAHSF